ncbi:MAG TPA: hypothetical protein VMY42_25940 [Thermoguttaceae bacterium]|nr:hypothetical protein [Thermoguttaceae bacterium]
MPEPRDHAENRGWIETILRFIPGFRGYLEKEYRRQSDDLQREWLADRLGRSKRAIDNVSRPLAEAGQIDLLPQVDRLRGRLDKLIGRIRGAVQGYSGFFDLVQVDENLLDRVYEHDAAIIKQVDALAEAIQELPARQDEIATLLGNLLRRTDELDDQWDVREDMLKGVE